MNAATRQDCPESPYRFRCVLMIPTHRRLEYTSGYLALGLLKEAASELALIEGDAAQSAEVMLLRLDLYHQSKQWAHLAKVAEALARLAPRDEQGWISWAYALRELGRVAAAQTVLLRAEPLHGKTSAVVHYNLACYACLLGNNADAIRRLATACKMDSEFRISALDDPDLKSMRDDIATME